MLSLESRLTAARKALARAVSDVRAKATWSAKRRRDALEPYVLAYSVAFADARARLVGPSADREDIRQVARIRGLAALDHLDTTMVVGRQLSYLHTVLAGALADAGRAADSLGRLGRSRHRSFQAAVEAEIRKNQRQPTSSEADRIARRIAGDGARYVDFYRCRYGADPLVDQPHFFGYAEEADVTWDPERAVTSRELLNAVSAHPEPDVRNFLLSALTGDAPGGARDARVARRPQQIVERLGPTLTDLLGLAGRAA